MDNMDTANVELNINSTEMGDKVTPKAEKTKKPKKASSDKRKAGITVLIIGIATLVAGLVFLLINLLKALVVRDADFLVEVGAWQMKDEPTVIWDFKEIGKGTLTTNFHINDYDFIWAMDGETLKIETAWLYTLNDEYSYKLNQGDKTLTLTSGENTYTFVPAEYPANKDEEKPAEEN